MNILIAEDEHLAQIRLRDMVLSLLPNANIVDIVDSRVELKEYLLQDESLDLLFLDIELSDGKSLELFNEIEIDIPIIFTTAYNQYAIEAFRYLSIGYLLKPIQLAELKSAIEKSKKFINSDHSQLSQALDKAKADSFKSKFLIKSGNKLLYKSASNVNYFYADGKEVYLVEQDNRKYLVDHSLDELENSLDPNLFFRISRKIIINIETVQEVRGFSSARLEVKSQKGSAHPLLISRGRVKEFKAWLDR